MATHSSVLAWRIPGTGEPGGLPSMGSHRVRHDWSDLAAAAAAASQCWLSISSDKSCSLLPGMGEEGTSLQREICGLLLAENRRAGDFSYICRFSITLMSKQHILGLHILIPFNMPQLPADPRRQKDTQGMLWSPTVWNEAQPRWAELQPTHRCLSEK